MVLLRPSSSGDIPQILLSPRLSALVIVDHQISFRSCFDVKSVKAAEDGVAILLDAARKIDIPIIASLVETNLINSKLSCTLEKMIPDSARFNRTGANPWDDPKFEKAVQVANRQCLLVAGLSAESSLSFTALHGLAMGFDIFVIKDACLGFSEQSIDVTFDRLIQAGAVPITWRQVMLEWHLESIDAGLLRRVLKQRRLPKS